MYWVKIRNQAFKHHKMLKNLIKWVQKKPKKQKK